jgi:hypothetical protein
LTRHRSIIPGDDEQLLEALLTLRDGIEEQQETLDRALESLESLPRRRTYLLLVNQLGNRLLQVQREWLDVVEAALSGGARGRSRPRARRPERG